MCVYVLDSFPYRLETIDSLQKDRKGTSYLSLDCLKSYSECPPQPHFLFLLWRPGLESDGCCWYCFGLFLLQINHFRSGDTFYNSQD